MYSAKEKEWFAQGYVDAGALHKNLIADLRYATPNNVFGRTIMTDVHHIFLQAEAAYKLYKAAELLTTYNSQLRVIVWDALRPQRVQQIMYDAVIDTAAEKYVANPGRLSMHNYGMAVDVGIAMATNELLDMGTGFDAFSPLSEPRHENQFVETGELTTEQLGNRKLLRSIMQQAGWCGIDSEWWHFEAAERDYIRTRYQPLL